MSDTTEKKSSQSWLNDVKWKETGLVCAIAQDALSLRVLMVAWMNHEALELTAKTGYAHYFSRSRAKLWKKGEESGHFQKVQQLRLDCDGDAIVMMIEQDGGIACHTGRESCFYRVLKENEWVIVDDVLKSTQEIYMQKTDS